jgi:hypothetical protein
MDLSKLPKMSQTPRPADGQPEPAKDSDSPSPPVVESASAHGSEGPEAWISIAIGAILLFWHSHFFGYLADPSNPIHEILTPTGRLPYLRSVFFPIELGGVLFGLALVVKGLVLVLVRGKAAILVAIVPMIIATMANLWAVLSAFPVAGFQIAPAVFAAVGVYIVLYQWRSLRGT